MTEAKKSPLKTVKDVTFFYTSTTNPTKQLNKDNKPPLSTDPLEFHAYEVKIAVKESVFKQLKKAFPGAKNFPNAKEIDAEEYCSDKWDPTAEVDEDMVLIKFTQSALVGRKGSRKPSKPITQIGIKGRVQDINGKSIDADTIIGNGSKGHLQFNPVENDFGLYLYPVAICITELVEYVGGSAASADYDAFGIEELDDAAFEETSSDDDDFSDPMF